MLTEIYHREYQSLLRLAMLLLYDLRGAVKTHAARGVAALRPVMEQDAS